METVEVLIDPSGGSGSYTCVCVERNQDIPIVFAKCVRTSKQECEFIKECLEKIMETRSISLLHITRNLLIDRYIEHDIEVKFNILCHPYYKIRQEPNSRFLRMCNSAIRNFENGP